MTTESTFTIPLDNLTPTQIKMVAEAYFNSITADLHEYPLNLQHPIWERMRDFRRIFAPSVTDEHFREILRESDADELVFLPPLRQGTFGQLFLEGLQLTIPPRPDRQEE